MRHRRDGCWSGTPVSGRVFLLDPDLDLGMDPRDGAVWGPVSKIRSRSRYKGGIQTWCEFVLKHFVLQAVITPEENMVVSFRGDACHYVETFSMAQESSGGDGSRDSSGGSGGDGSGDGRGEDFSEGSQHRVSLVVEQYRLLPEDKKLVVPYTASIALGHGIPKYTKSKPWWRTLFSSSNGHRKGRSRTS